MTDHTARIGAMTKNAMHDMFTAEKSGDREKMDAAAKDYTALCAAVVAMEEQTPKRLAEDLHCPNCRMPLRFVMMPLQAEHCGFCGQKLREEKDE